MTFLWPAGLAFLGLIPGIVLLYFLRLKRDVKVVSSTWLWRRALDEYRVNRPFQRFRNHALLWLQLLAVLLLAGAVSRPCLEAVRPGSGIHIVLVDQSASMGVREEGGRTRLDLAREFLRSMIHGLKPGDRMMIAGFSDRVVVAAPMTAAKADLLRAVDSLGPTQRPTRVEEAWQTALAVARQYDSSEVYLLSDGGFRKLPALTEANADVHFVPFGRSTDNVGITQLESRRGEDPRSPLEIFARISNGRAQPADVLVQLLLDDQVVDASRAVVSPASEGGVVFRRPAGDEGVAEVRLSVSDAFPLDDRAWLPMGGDDLARVAVVGEDNVFLKQALAMNPRVELTVVPPADFPSLKDRLTEVDLVVFDGTAPDALRPGSYLFLGSLPPVDGFQGGPERQQPALVKWDREHPLTQFINFSTLHVARGIEVSAPGWMKPLLESDGSPLISAGERGGVRLAVVAFRPLDSDWPLRISYPLFFANAVSWAKEEAGTRGRSVRPGEPLSIRAPMGAGEGDLTDPAGVTVRIRPGRDGRILHGRTEATGLYRVRWPGRPTAQVHAVNLLDPAESDIAVPGEIALGERAVKARAGNTLVRVEIWPWLLLAGLGVLVLEWLVYQYGRG